MKGGFVNATIRRGIAGRVGATPVPVTYLEPNTPANVVDGAITQTTGPLELVKAP